MMAIKLITNILKNLAPSYFIRFAKTSLLTILMLLWAQPALAACPDETKKNTLWYTDYYQYYDYDSRSDNYKSSGIFTIEAGSTGGRRTYNPNNDYYGDIAVAADGYIYIASLKNGDIIKFSKDGRTRIGSIGRLNAGNLPNGLAFDENGYLYVGYWAGAYYQVKDINNLNSYSKWFDPRTLFNGSNVGSSGDVIFVGGKAYVSINDNNMKDYLIELTLSNANIVSSSRIIGRLPDASYGLSTDGFGRVFVGSEKTVKQLNIPSNKSLYGQYYTIPTQIVATDTAATGNISGLSSVNESLSNADCSATLSIRTTIINDDGGNININDINLITNAGNLAFNNASSTGGGGITYISDALNLGAGSYDLEAGRYSGYSLGEWSCTHSNESITNYRNPPQNTKISINIAKGDNVVCNITYDDKPPNKCFAMTDNASKLYKFDLDISTAPVVVDTKRLLNGEAATYRASNSSIYTFNQDLGAQDEDKPSDLYKVSLDGAVTLVKKAFLSKKANGAEFVRYVDGREHLITLQNKNHSTISIFDATDLTTATPLETITLLTPDGGSAHMDGLAINPLTGEVLVSDDIDSGGTNSSTDHSKIYSVNMSTGTLTLLVTLKIPGIETESLAFDEDGYLYTENDKLRDENGNLVQNPPYNRKIFRINLSTGDLTAVENIATISGDIEGMSCTGSKVFTAPPPSFTKESTPNTAEAGNTVSFTYKIKNDLGLDLSLDFNDDLRAVNDFIGTIVNESIAPITGVYIPNTLSITNANGTSTFSNNNKTLAINQLSIAAHTTATIQIDMFVPNSLDAGNYFTQAALRNLVYSGAINNNSSTIVYSDDPTSANFPDPTLLTVTSINSCDALTGNINAGLSPVSSLTNNDKIFLGSTDLSNKEGHLKAFNVDAAGAVTGNALWDVASLMDATIRSTHLYASDDSFQKSTLSGLSTILTYHDFGVANTGAVTALTTSINNAKLGSLSAGSHLALITNEMDTLGYLNDPYYRSHYTSTIASRTKRFLASSDDGFLYAFNQEDGELGWGWMPHSLLSELKDGSAAFISKHYMQGVIDVVDIKDSTTSYKSYVVGSYRQGLGHYILRLSDDEHSNLDNVVWEQDLNGLKTSSPNNGKPEYFKDASGTAYIAYVASDDNSSTLYIKKITDSSVVNTISLGTGVIITSTPYIMASLDGGNGKTIFIGDKDGNIYSTNLLDSNGALNSKNTITSGLNSAVSTLKLNTSDTGPVLFIGGARSSKNNGYYLRAQSAGRLTMFKYNSGNWERQWTSATSGATRWMKDNNNTIVADINDNNVISLQTGSTITDNAYIVADSIVLPVMHAPDPNSNNCDGASYYYFYNLTDGHFPTNTFYSGTTAVTAKLNLGVGKTRALHLANLLGSDSMLGLGMSDQTSAGGTGINTSIIIKDPFTAGIRSWRELRD